MVKRIDISGDGSWNESPTGAWVSSRNYDALASELAAMTADYHRWHQAYCDAKYPESVPLSWQQTAEALKAAEARVKALEAALYGAAESLASFRPQAPDHSALALVEFPPAWTELDEVTLHDAQRLCGKYPQESA